MGQRIRSAWLAFQVGCTYIGTVVGAGFASGQEIFRFFGRFGTAGVFAIALAAVLFAWLGYRVMYLGHVLRARSYRELNRHLFGETVGTVLDVVLSIMLFGVTVAMIAGAGALFQQSLHISFQWGALLTMVVTYFTIVRGMRGIVAANTVIVPAMIGFVLFAGLHVLHHTTPGFIWATGAQLSQRPPLLSVVSAILYVAFNIGLATGVLIPLGANVPSLRTLRTGAALGATGLGVMLFAVTGALFANYPDVMQLDIPMARVAGQIGSIWQWLFLLVLWGEIYSTLVGNVYSVAAQFSQGTGRRLAGTTAILLLLAYLGSQVGFTRLVTHVYGVFGWISVFLVLVLLWPREKLPTA